MEPKNPNDKRLEAYLERLANPPQGILSEAEELQWSLDVLQPYLDPVQVARTNATYHNQPEHLSQLLLALWLDGERSDEQIRDHVQGLEAHCRGCANCQSSLSHYSQRKGYSPM